jgi:membrane-bound inhibitor of C-type lysozyme
MMNPFINRLLIAFLAVSALALTACSAIRSTPSNNAQTDDIEVIYQCERGSVLNVTFAERGYTTIHGGKHYKKRYHEKPSVAIVHFGDNQTVTLTQEVSGSGFSYSNGQYALRGKGNEAIWTIGRMADEHCVAD